MGKTKIFKIKVSDIKDGMPKEELEPPKLFVLMDNKKFKRFKLGDITFRAKHLPHCYVNFQVNASMSILAKKHNYMSPGMKVKNGETVHVDTWIQDEINYWKFLDHKKELEDVRVSIYICFDQKGKKGEKAELEVEVDAE